MPETMQAIKISNKNNTLNQKDTLLIAIGNSARRDDGLGWAFKEQIEKLGLFKGEMINRYQLQVEDAELISHYPRVIFVDATENYFTQGYVWEKTRPLNEFSFTTHALSPEAILFICQDLYERCPEAYTLKICGRSWSLKTGLSKHAKINLTRAKYFFKEKLK